MPTRIRKGLPWFVYMFVQRTRHADASISFRTEIHKSQSPWRHLHFSRFWGSPSKYPSTRSSTLTTRHKSDTPTKVTSGTRKKSRKRSGCLTEYAIAMIIGPFDTEYSAMEFSHVWCTNTRAAIPRCTWGVVLSKEYNTRVFLDWNVLVDTSEFSSYRIKQHLNAVIVEKKKKEKINV